MPKTPSGTRRFDIYVPDQLADRLEALLRSELLGRIPRGSINNFFVQRLNEFLGSERLPLHQYSGFAADDWVSGPPSAVRKIALALAPLRKPPEGMDEAFPELNPLSR